MKKLKLLLLLFISLPFSGLAQDFDYEVSQPYLVVDANRKFYLNDGEELLGLKIRGGTYLVQKWNAGTLKETQRSEFVELTRGFRFEEFLELNDRYILFYSIWDKPNLTEQLFYREFDFESGKFVDDGHLLLKVKGRVTGAFGGGTLGDNFAKFNIESSFDESVFMVQYRIKPEEKKDELNKDVIGFAVFTSDLEEVYSEQIQMPYTEAKMNNLDYTIDSDGNVFLLSMVYKDDTQRLSTKDGDVNYEIELLRIDLETKELIHTPFNLGTDVFLSDVALFNTKKNDIICTGFYTNDRRTIGNANGLIIAKVSPKGEVSDIRKYEIPVEVLNMYNTERQQKRVEKADEKGEAEFSNLDMRNLIVDEDGSLLLIGEQHYVMRHTTTVNGKTQTYYTYHYNDLLVTKIHPDGELAWMKKMAKRQTGQGSSRMTEQGGMSFKYFANKNSHYFLFLDNVKNLELGLNENPAGHSDGAGGFLTAYKIDDETGKVSKVSLFDTRDVHGIEVFQFQVDRIQQISADEFVVEVYKKKKEDILIKVKVKI